MRKIWSFVLLSVMVILVMLAALGVSCDQALGTGTLRLYLSDAPIDAENVTGVYITINEIQCHPQYSNEQLGDSDKQLEDSDEQLEDSDEQLEDSDEQLDGEWITCEGFVGPRTYDLLELTGGNSTLLGQFPLPAGNYTQIRFILNIPELGSSPANPGCYIEFADNSTQPLFVPSGDETGYKAIGQFTVPLDGTVEVTADFDVREAVVVAGSSYVLKPTIKLIVND